MCCPVEDSTLLLWPASKVARGSQPRRTGGLRAWLSQAESPQQAEGPFTHRRIDEHTEETTWRKDGNVIIIVTRVPGKAEPKNLMVYEKQ